MGFHATIGNRQTAAPRVKASDRRVMSNPMQTGTRTYVPGDQASYDLGFASPDSAVYSETREAFGAEFASKFAKPVVVRGDWRKAAKDVWTIQTSEGMLRVGKMNGQCVVILNRDYLGQYDWKRMATAEGKDMLIVQIIAGTLTR
jgi:hypothetical protein